MTTARRSGMSAAAAFVWIVLSMGIGAGLALAFHITDQPVPLMQRQNILTVDGQQRDYPHAFQHVDDDAWRRIEGPTEQEFSLTGPKD